MNFTKEQQCAIYATNREVLVSAAAGSGKTAVLVERILHLIKDEGYSIERMLIVTYTRAAAAELRERLETRIQEAAIEEPALAREADKVSGAQISTIHSYCQKVVKEQFRFCQIDPQFFHWGRAHHAIPLPGQHGGNLGWVLYLGKGRCAGGGVGKKASGKNAGKRGGRAVPFFDLPARPP